MNIYIADFYCHKLKLVVAIDGVYHQKVEQQQSDAERIKTIEFQGLMVIRFSNEEIITKVSEVLNAIKEFIKKEN